MISDIASDAYVLIQFLSHLHATPASSAAFLLFSHPGRKAAFLEGLGTDV